MNQPTISTDHYSFVFCFLIRDEKTSTDVPDKVTELKVTNTTSSTILLRWQLAFSGNSPVTSYLVQHLADDPLDDLLVSMAQPSSGSSSSSTNNNQPKQRLLGGDGGVDLGGVGGDKGAPATSSPLKVALEALNGVGANSVDSAIDEIVDRKLVEQTVEQSATHLTVKDLDPFCVYRLRLAAINKIGLGEFSDWIRAKTEEAPPGGSASKIVAAATGPNSIKVTWSPPDRRAWNGQLIGFNIGYRPMDSTFELNKTIEWSAPSLQSMVLDARNKQLSSSKTSSPPELGSEKSLPQTNTTTAIMQQQQHQQDQRYSLRQHLRQLLALQQQELVAHLTNLQRSTTYLLWVQAINSKGVGPQSHAVSVKTLDDVPPSAPALKIQATSSSSITIAWSMLSNFVSPANQYSLFYRKVPSGQLNVPTIRQQSSRVSSNSSHDEMFVYDSTRQHQQLAFGLNPNMQDSQPQPFIERSITSQQLMASGNMNLIMGDYADGHNNAADLKYMHQQQQSQQQQQHYQQFVYVLDQLDCGSVYELYMSTRNSVGKSEPSAMISTRTMGEAPLAPINKNNFFSKIGINEVALNLAAWSTGGCPIAHMTVRYKQSPMPLASASTQSGGIQQSPSGSINSSSSSSSSMSVTWPITTSVPVSLLNALNNHQLQLQQPTGRSHYLSSSSSDLHLKNVHESPVYYLKNLMPSSCYELEVLAYNTAGHTSAQYEFVTSNLNGTRAGYSRREGVYRVELGGLPQHELAADGSARAAIEQQMQAYKQSSSAQILPLLLMVGCLICLIISSVFCYNRLSGSWKQRRRRRNSNDTSSRGGHGGGANSSPGSIGGKSSMWGNVGTDTRYGALSAGRKLQQDGSGESHLHAGDSPTTTLHYCMREPPQPNNQASMSATLNPKTMPASSFGQSVSMKDFNLPNGSKFSNGTTTLNYKNYNRATLRHPVDYKTTTLRARLCSEHPNLEGHTFLGQSTVPAQAGAQDGAQICHDSTLCKQRQAAANSYIELARNDPNQDPYSSHQFNYTSQDSQQLQQETSWTNHYHTQCIDQQTSNGATAYAVPTAAAAAAASNYANEQIHHNNNNYGTRHDESANNHHRSSIDACIQQLIDQQYQSQQQQQQPYSMVVNFKPDQCALYDTAKPGGQIVEGNQNVLKSQQQQPTTITCPPPCMDSSSSSSGIDVGAHLECASTTTGTSNSNTSNDAYNNNNNHHHPSRLNNFSTDNGSEFAIASTQYSLQNVMQQFNDEPA